MKAVTTSMKSSKLKEGVLEERLQEGQLWRIKRHYVYVVALLGSSIRFKLMDSPNETGTRILTSSVDTLLRYVLSRKGKLVIG